MGLVPDKTYARRLAACHACEHYVAAPDDVLHLVGRRVLGDERVCARCGCFMSLKARFALSIARSPTRTMDASTAGASTVTGRDTKATMADPPSSARVDPERSSAGRRSQTGLRVRA